MGQKRYKCNGVSMNSPSNIEEYLYRICDGYITTIFEGIEGDILRSYWHRQFVHTFGKVGIDEEKVDGLLHNLDRVIDFHIEMLRVYKRTGLRKFFVDELYKRILKLYGTGERQE